MTDDRRMSNDTAIYMLLGLQDQCLSLYSVFSEGRYEALNIAIAAIKQAPDDAVSRHDVLELIEEIQDHCIRASCCKRVMNLPQVYPKPKTGHWIMKTEELGAMNVSYAEEQCSNCGWSHSLVIPTNYCPNCGAKMEGLND